MTRPRAAWLTATAALTLLCSPTQAQWEVTPGVGLYHPLGPVIAVPASAGARALDMRQLATPMVGIRVGRRFGSLSIEAGAEFAPGLVAVRDTAGTADIASGLLFGSVRILGRLVGAGPGEAWSLRLGGGPGLLRRWGEAWEGFSGTTDLAFGSTVAAGFESRGLPIAFRLEVTNYLYDAGFVGPDGRRLGTGLSSELMWFLGASVPLDFDGG